MSLNNSFGYIPSFNTSIDSSIMNQYGSMLGGYGSYGNNTYDPYQSGYDSYMMMGQMAPNPYMTGYGSMMGGYSSPMDNMGYGWSDGSNNYGYGMGGQNMALWYNSMPQTYTDMMNSPIADNQVAYLTA